MSTTPAYVLVDYEDRADLKGGSSGRRVVTCAWEDAVAVRAAFIGSVDPDNANNKCVSGTIRHLNNDAATGIAEIEFSYAPTPVVDMRRTNAALRFRIEGCNESFTIKGAYKWPDGEPITNRDVLPVLQVATARAVLYGSRSSFSLGTWSGYFDKVNSDTFLGATKGQLLFKSVAAADRQDARTSALVYDIELHLYWRARPWNQFYREETGAWEELKLGSANVYSETAFSGLLGPP